MNAPETWMAFAVLGLLAMVAIASDIRSRRLPNILSIATAISGFLFAYLIDGADVLLSHGLHFALALAGGIALYAMKFFGAGDAKFYAAVAAWFPLALWLPLLIIVTLSGAVLLVVWLTIRNLFLAPVENKADREKRQLPYGIAISAGGLITYALMSINV